MTLAQRVGGLCRLTGEFTLRSGQRTNTYFDKYLFLADPALLREIVALLVPLVPTGTEVLAGVELGGVPIATALSSATGLPLCMVRKAAKTYGTAKLAEGADVDGKRVLIVEDVISTGGQVVASTEELRALGAHVDRVVCVIDRSEGEHALLSDARLELSALFASADLL